MLRAIFLGLTFVTFACVTTPDQVDINFEISKSTLAQMSSDMKKAKEAESPLNVDNLGCWKDKCRVELSHEDGKVGSMALTPDDLKTLQAAMKKSKADQPLEASTGNSSVTCTPSECSFMISKEVELDPKTDYWASGLLADLKSQSASSNRRKKK